MIKRIIGTLIGVAEMALRLIAGFFNKPPCDCPRIDPRPLIGRCSPHDSEKTSPALFGAYFDMPATMPNVRCKSSFVENGEGFMKRDVFSHGHFGSLVEQTRQRGADRRQIYN